MLEMYKVLLSNSLFSILKCTILFICLDKKKNKECDLMLILMMIESVFTSLFASVYVMLCKLKLWHHHF